MADFNLPNEIWCMIFTYLPLKPKKNATATCKLWSRLIREDPKLSGYILISWYNMKTAIATLQWNWENWPVLKTLELKSHSLTAVEDFELLVDSKESIQNVIEKLSLIDHCSSSLEEVIFAVDLTLIQTYGQSLLKYQRQTNEIFGFGQTLDSLQKWKEYESNMKALKRLPPNILAKFQATSVPSNDLLLLIASPYFRHFRNGVTPALGYNHSILAPAMIHFRNLVIGRKSYK
jgi:hypothetical protein